MSKSIALVLVLAAGCWSDAKPQPAQPQPQAQIEPKQVAVKDIVQPVKMEKGEIADDGEEGGVEGGVEGGEIGGVEGGVVGGVVGAPPPPPPPPPPPAPPQVVPPNTLEANRVGGTKFIEPDAKTKTEITRSGKAKVIASFKLCLGTDGAVTSVTMLKSSGFPSYDAKLNSTIRATWTYSPYIINGKPTPVCTAVTFIYASS